MWLTIRSQMKATYRCSIQLEPYMSWLVQDESLNSFLPSAPDTGQPYGTGATIGAGATFLGETRFKAKTKVCLAAKVMAGVWKEFPEVSLIPIPRFPGDLFIQQFWQQEGSSPLKRWSITTNSKNMLPRVQVYLHHKWDVGFNFFGHISLAIFRGLPFQGV